MRSQFQHQGATRVDSDVGFLLRPVPSIRHNVAVGRYLSPHPSPLTQGEGAGSADLDCGGHLANGAGIGGTSQSGVALRLSPRSTRVQLHGYSSGRKAIGE